MRPLILAACLWSGATAVGAQSGQPLSAIDWLSRSVLVPQVQPPSSLAEPPISSDATAPNVTTTPLDGASPDPIGLLDPATTALPMSLWSGSDEATLITLISAQSTETLPAAQDLLKTLLLAKADPPRGASPAGALFQTRIDKLLDLGAIEPAEALLEQAHLESPDLFRRWFDVALLNGTENRACRVMQRRIDVAPTYAARVFCLARMGDWPAAVLTLNTHVALGDLSEHEEALLARFLDPDLFEGEPPLAPPERKSPLMFRMFEAIGQPMSTTSLPRAFAHADLRTTMGWKSQLEAAERLTRHGAIAPNVLFALYSSRTPSASGGVWDRAAAMTKLEAALQSADATQVAEVLPAAWDAAQSIGVQTAFATEYAAALIDLGLPEPAASIASTVVLLSPSYETVDPSASGIAAAYAGLAQGVPSADGPRDPMYLAIRTAFDEATPPANLMALADTDKMGEAILRALALFDAGADGDTQAVTEALAFFRAVGLEDVARRASLQLLLLERRT